MKKLIPLLVIAAGAVAYGVYKSRKETENKDEDKTLVVIDDTLSGDDSSQPVGDIEKEAVEDIEKEAVEEVQQELGYFETLSDSDEPYERPSFFHVTEDSILKSDEFNQLEEESDALTITEDAAEVFTEEPELSVEEVIEEPVVLVVPDEELTEESAAVLKEESEIDIQEEMVETLEEKTEDSVVSEDCETVEVIETLTDEAETSEPETEDEEECVEAVEENSEDPIEEDTAESVVVNEEEAFENQTEELEVTENEEVDNLIEEIAGHIEESNELFEEESVESDEEEPELEPLQSYNTPEVDELMKEIAGQVKAADQAALEETEVEEETKEEVVEPSFSEETDYLQDIRKITELYSEKVAQYNIRYPYLSSRFIDDTLKFSHQFNAEYPVGTRVAIEHYAHFTAIEDLFVFAQIIRQSGYAVKEGAEDKTLVVIREMFVDNNTILHDVFKVANQVYCLSGEYQKFRITKR